MLVDGLNMPKDKVQNYFRCPTRDRPKKPNPDEIELKFYKNQSIFSKFFYGLKFNPRFGSDFDFKMYLYLVGAIMLWLNIFSAVFKAYEVSGRFTKSSLLFAWLFNHFLVEYLYFEEIHLYTYDLFAEKIGFKLLWGCFVFYPFFYCIGAHYLVSEVNNKAQQDMSLTGCLLVAGLFYSGWFLTRGSNLQKFDLKKNPNSKYFFNNLIEQKTLSGTKIIVSGFWGLARHVNYFGEIIQSLALSIPCWYLSGSLVPFLYPMYYVALFVPRQFDDDAICRQKYGKKWEEYQKLVPYRMVPYVW